MATNHIDGDLVGIYISTNLTVPAWKELVCGMNSAMSGQADVSSKKTKCGVIKTVGPFGWQFTATGTHNTAPATDQISADDLITIAQSGASVLVKTEHAVDDSLLYRTGTGVVSKYDEKANSGESLEYDITVDITGLIVITP